MATPRKISGNQARRYRGRYGHHRDALLADAIAERGQAWVDEHDAELQSKLAYFARTGLLIPDEEFARTSPARQRSPRLLGLTPQQRAQGLRQMAAAVIYVPDLARRRRRPTKRARAEPASGAGQ